MDHINSIQEEYCKKRLKRYESIQQYDGTCNSAIIYYLEQDSELIDDKLQLLNECLANPEVGFTNSDELENSNENAFVLQGTITDDDNDILVKLISLKRPFTTLQHRFFYENGEFRKIKKAVLNLSVLFDILIVGEDKIYFLNLAGENLFNLERAYKNICKVKVADIIATEILSNVDTFEKVATSGHNPRKFVSYDKDKLDYLSDNNNREAISNKFGIRLNDDKVDTSDARNIDKLIKFLCNKAVLDPTTLEPKESDGTRNWTT